MSAAPLNPSGTRKVVALRTSARSLFPGPEEGLSVTSKVRGVNPSRTLTRTAPAAGTRSLLVAEPRAHDGGTPSAHRTVCPPAAFVGPFQQ